MPSRMSDDTEQRPGPFWMVTIKGDPWAQFKMTV